MKLSNVHDLDYTDKIIKTMTDGQASFANE